MLGQVPGAVAPGPRLPAASPRMRGRPRVREEEADQDLQRRGLARAVRAEVPEDLAPRDREVEALERGAELRPEVAGAEGLRRGRGRRGLDPSEVGLGHGGIIAGCCTRGAGCRSAWAIAEPSFVKQITPLQSPAKPRTPVWPPELGVAW